MKHTRSRIPFFLMAGILVIACFNVGNPAIAKPKPPTPTPTPLPEPPSRGSATVDGDPNEWDLSNDWYADMSQWGEPGNEKKAELYLRYDCGTQTLFALVLCVGDNTLKTDKTGSADHSIEVGDDEGDKLNVVVNHLDNGLPTDGTPPDGTPPDFKWVTDISGNTIGWEASASVPEGLRSIRVHTYTSDNNLQSIIVRDDLPGSRYGEETGSSSSGRSNALMSVASGGGGNTPSHFTDDLPPSLSLMCHSYWALINLCCEKRCEPCPDYHGFVRVDGIVGDEWDLDEDFYTAMHRSGQTTTKPIESNLYIKYDCLTETLYVLVLCVDGVTITNLNTPNQHVVYIDGKTGSYKIVEGKNPDDGLPPFEWVYNTSGQVIGWEACGTVAPGLHTILVHTQVFSDGESQTSAIVPKDTGILIDLCCECLPCEDFVRYGTWFSVSFPGLNDLFPPYKASSYFRSFLWFQDPSTFAPTEYPGWCVDLFTMMDVRTLFGGAGEVELYRTLNTDGSSNMDVNLKSNLIGTSENLAKVNYILNQFRRGYYYDAGVTWTEIQAAIWELLSVGQSGSGPGKLIISGSSGRGGFITWNNDLRNLVIADAAGIDKFEFTSWDVVAVIVWCGAEQQVTIIEVPACYYDCLLDWSVLEDPETP